ncbi:MAG: mannosyltransferase [Bacteroidia bacterium]|jgi:mannosyltransferase
MAAPSPTQVPPNSQRDPIAGLLLVAACLLGTVVFVRLGHWSLWIDEAFALSDSLFRSPKNNPLGYWIFERYFELMGARDGIRPDEFTMRFLPALLGWLGVPLTFWAFYPAAGKRVAAGAALILAASAWHLYWSQNARFYTLVQDLVLVASGLYLRGLWQNSALKLSAGLLAFGVASMAHPTAAIVGAALFLAPFLLQLFRVRIPGMDGPPRKAMYIFGALGMLVLVIWAPQVWATWNGDAAKGVGSPAHLVLTFGFFVTPVLGAAALFASYQVIASRSTFGRFALATIVASILAALFTSMFARVSAQYLFGLLPWIALLAAMPLGYKSSKHSARADAESHSDGTLQSSPLALGLLSVVVLSGLTQEALYLTVRQGERPKWREAYRYVWNHRAPSDQIFGMAGPVAEYYLEPRKLEVRDVRGVTYLNKFTALEPGKWARVDRKSWFVLNREELYDWPTNRRIEFTELLSEDCRLVKSWPLFVESRDLSVEVYVRD